MDHPASTSRNRLLERTETCRTWSNRNGHWHRYRRRRRVRGSVSWFAPCRFTFCGRRAAAAERGFDNREALLRHTLTAVAGQKGHESSHLLEIRGVVDEPSLLP